MKKLFLLLLVYCLFFKPDFIFVPHSMNLLLSLFGFSFFVFDSKTRKQIINRTGFKFGSIISILAPVVIISFVSIIINLSLDLYYIKYTVSILMSIFSCYLIAYFFFKFYGAFKYQVLLDYLVVATIIFLIISILMFLNSGFDSIIMSIQKENPMDISTSGLRLHTLGVSYFTAGVVLGFILILISFGITEPSITTVHKIFYILSFLFISITGLMIARSILVGILISLFVIFIVGFKEKQSRLFKPVILSVIPLFFIVIAFSKVMTKYESELDALSKFGFELFINYKDNGQLSSSSTDGMKEMYERAPNTVKTWLIGDAKWNEKDGSYYKQVDIGYLRNIYYFGVIGTLFLILYFYRTLEYSIQVRSFSRFKYRLCILSLLAYVLILNLKGNADLVFIALPFLFTKELITYEKPVG